MACRYEGEGLIYTALDADAGESGIDQMRRNSMNRVETGEGVYTTIHDLSILSLAGPISSDDC